MNKKRLVMFYHDLVENFDKGVVIAFNQTGFAWTLLVAFVAYIYVETYPHIDREAISKLVELWPVATTLLSMGIGFLLSLYPEEAILPFIRFFSGCLLFLSFLLMLWKMGWTWLSLAIILVMIILPLIKEYLPIE